jgi:hypothetical protein
MLLADPALQTLPARFGFGSWCETLGRNRRGERDHDEGGRAVVEHEFKAADVAAIDLLRQWSILLVLNLDATGRTGPGHGCSRGTQAAGPMAILGRAAGAAFEKVPAFDRPHAAQHGRPVDERSVALGAEQLRGWGLRGRREHGISWLTHCHSTRLRPSLAHGNFRCRRCIDRSKSDCIRDRENTERLRETAHVDTTLLCADAFGCRRRSRRPFPGVSLNRAIRKN